MGKIYVVDDDAAMRQSLVSILEAAGFAVEAFDGGEAFLAAFDAQQAACIVLDLVLPGMDGLAVQQALSSRHVRTPLLMLTAYGSVTAAVAAIKAGAFDFLEKPVDGKVLIARIHQALSEDAGRRERRIEAQGVRHREATLSPREREVMKLIVSGLTNQQIAQALHISTKTVASHRLEVMHKMAAANAADLARMITLARYAS